MSLLRDRLADLPAPDEPARAPRRGDARRQRAPPDRRAGVARRRRRVEGRVAAQRVTDRRAPGGAGLRRRSRRRGSGREQLSERGDGGDARRHRARAAPTINAFAAAAGASVTAVDVGVGRPTADIRHGPALTPERFDEITAAAFDGRRRARHRPAGARRTRHRQHHVRPLRSPRRSPGARRRCGSAAAPASTTPASPASSLPCRNRSAGSPVSSTRSRSSARSAASELVGMAAAAVAARHRSIPVVLDGYICTAAMLPLHVAEPTALDHCIVGHCSAEPGHRLLLERIGQATAARPRHAPRRGYGCDGRGAARADGVRRRRRGRDVRRVVRSGRLMRPLGLLGAFQFLTRIPIRLARGTRPAPHRCRGSRSSARLIGAAVGGVAAGLGHLVPATVAAARRGDGRRDDHRSVPRGRSRRHRRRDGRLDTASDGARS